MSIIRALLKTWQRPQRNTKKFSLESRQTGSCGGMSTTELKIRMELILEGVDTSRTIEPVTELAALSHALQSEFLTQLSEIAELSVTHAYSLMLVYTSALNSMGTSEHQYWLEKIKQAIMMGELDQAESLIHHYTDFASQLDKSTVHFAEVAQILEKLISAISQHELTVSCIEVTEKQLPYTDGQQLFLPVSISLFDSYSDNYLLYKVITFQLLGQLECDTRLAADRIKQGLLDRDDNFLHHFSILETLRINHYLKKAFPGIWNNILYLHGKSNLVTYPGHIFSNYDQTSVFDSLHLIEQAGSQPIFSEPLPYQCDFSPEKLFLFQSEEHKKQPVLMNLFNDNIEVGQGEVADDKIADRISLRHNTNAASPSNLAEKHSDIWEQLNETVTKYQEEQEKLRDEKKQKNVYLYPEWDTSLKQYRQDWCRVEEVPIKSSVDETQTLDIYNLRFSEYRIKKTLDMIINTQRFIRYQSDGDEVDIDAWVDASSNKTKHADDFQHVYIRNNKNSRCVAIMFAVDISGSTTGWKNKIIQQSVWLLSRTLSKLDDQFAIYAFSGSGREQCDIYPIKQFDEKYNSLIKQRIACLTAKQYTRMGAAIRHLSKLLHQTEAKTKILFVLTDGKPDDIDSYRGHYGVEDTRRAFNEAKALYLNPFVLTFDHECIDYLPYMIGKNRYRLISDISMLPVQISTIYRQLTT